MYYAPVTNWRMGRNGFTKFYVVRHIRFLLWRSALCGASAAMPAGRPTERPLMPHNFHQKLCLRGSPVRPDQQTFPNWVLSGLRVIRPRS